MKTTLHRRIFIVISVLATVLVAGCTHTIRPPKNLFMAYVGNQKVHLAVGLNITDQLLAAKDVWHYMGDKWVIAIGPYLATNATVLARHTFGRVVELRNGKLPPSESVTAILTPEVASINRTIPPTSFGKSIVDIKLLWTLSTVKGRVVWADTIDGRNISSGWTSESKILKRALEDLLTKSSHALATAPAIRQFAASQPAM